MSCLDATFTLTPRSPWSSGMVSNYAYLNCYGADFWSGAPTDLSSLYASNPFFFDGDSASDPNLDYTQWANRKKARYLYFYINLSAYGAANKQLALIFGFDVWSSFYPGRVLVYSDAVRLKDQQFAYATISFSSKSSPWINRSTSTSSTRVVTGFSRD